MRIGLTGATGFIGSAFARLAESAGHSVVGFSRRPKEGQRDMTALDFSGLDAVVHLAGENVFGLWTKGRKRRIAESRIGGTERIVAAMRALPAPPRRFVCASGVAWYGDRGDEQLDESSPPGSGFLADVVKGWENAAFAAESFASVACLRFGVVLDKSGGAGRLLRRIFRCCLGGRLGSGSQWMSAIHLTDAARLILHAVEKEIRGPVNAVCPEPLTNREFTREFAGAVRRPAILPAPAFFLRALPGGMASLFLDSLRVLPKAALDSGFTFQFPTLLSAIHDIAS